MNLSVLLGWLIGWIAGHFAMAAHAANDDGAAVLVWFASYALTVALAVAAHHSKASA